METYVHDLLAYFVYPEIIRTFSWVSTRFKPLSTPGVAGLREETMVNITAAGGGRSGVA